LNSDRIAAFLNDRGEVDSLMSAAQIHLYLKTAEGWTQMEKHYVNLSSCGGIPELRAGAGRIAALLGDCRIAAGKELSGIVYSELDRRGFSLFEISDCGPATLDGILRDCRTEQAGEGTISIPVKPIETETPGVYELDLLRLQEAYPDISSKQALREFLDTTPFYELRLVCGHIPPWLENGPYDISGETVSGTVVATVRKKQCGGG
jgi:Fe-only nitrogenase accessory protein AnfO